MRQRSITLPRLRDDHGVATVLVTAVLGGVLVLIGAVAIAVDIVHAKSRASTAADMAALAGAQEVLLGEPCDKAASIATANQSRVDSCELSGEDVQVVVKTALQGAASTVFQVVRIDGLEVTAVSRAGPPPCDQGLNSLGISC